MNFHELDNFNLDDAVKFHRRLNPRIWGSDEHLLPEVQEKLQAIAADFQEFLGVDDLRVQDITISGSNAAYSYTPHSDIDLHLVVDMPDNTVYQELFAAKKYQYNDEHSIRIAGVPVELYVQPAGQDHVSQGIYSIKNNDWNQVPQRRRAKVDDSCVQHKTADLDSRIHSAVTSGDADAVNRLWDRIKDMRKTGLEQNGEFGCENITFKLLRNMGCIGRLKDAKNALRDRELSLEQSTKPRERKRMNYGMRDYWFPGTAYAGQDHPAGTESEQVDESADPDQLKKILHRFYKSCVGKLELKNPPQLRLETTPDWSRENGSFGQYESETNTLILATYGRHVLDILRTMAHEMTHRQQDEREPLPIDAGETGSPWEDQANAMAGRIMRDWAEEQPEMFDGVTLEEASGYIPTKAQAKDPRFVMALTRDVRPGAVGKEANKLGLQTDSQGHPALLTAGLNKLLREFKEQDLFEINMGGKNLRREAAKTGALAGMEFEMIVPDTSSEDDELEPDWDMDQRASSPSDIRDFFHDGDYNGRRNAQELVDRMLDDYGSWQVERFDTRWDSDAETFIYDYLKENVDEDSIKELVGLEPEDEFGKKEYQLVADKIATEQLEPFYSDALELSREEFYENDNFDEWLSDADLTRMSEIADRYNGIIHWPHYTSSGGGTSVEDIADSFSRAVGRPVKASSGYHSSSVERPAPGKNFYIVEPDGSLEADGPGDSGLEFVSPPLPIDQIMSDLNKVKKWADQTGCYTNDSTGLHINISVPDYDLKKLDFVKLALLMGDEYVLQQFGRVGNTYAKSAMGKVRDHVRQRPFEAKYLLDKMKGHMGALASKAIHSGSTEKYTSINTKDGHIEFRSPGGDWLDNNFDKIENTLMRFTVAMSAALDPEAYRQEYLKKLYKILAPKDEKDPLAVFAKYAAGELPAAALKSFVRQAQAERKTQKDIKNSKDMSLWKVVGSSNLPTQARGLTVKARNELEAFDQAAKVWNLNPELREKDYYEFNGWTAEKLGVEGQYAIVRRDDPRIRTGIGSSGAPDYLFRLSLPPDPTQDQMREALQAWASQEGVYMGDYMIVDTTRYSAPAQSAGASATEPHPEGRGRPNDPTGRYAITRRDDQRNYGNHVGSEAPDYQFRFTLPDGYSQAQMRSVLSAWAVRNAVNAEDYMIVDTTQFAAPEQNTGSVQWNIVDRNGQTVHTFWNRNVQADANTAAHQWLMSNDELPSVDMQGPFEVVPVTSAAAPADADTVTYEIYDREDSSPLETFQAANDAAALEFLNQYRSMGPHTLNSQQATAAFGVRRAPVPGSTLDLQRQRQRDAALAAASMAADAEHAANRQTPTPIPGVQDIEPDVAQYTSQPAAAPRWEVYRRSDGVSMFPLDAATQAAAWAEGRQWVQQTSNDTGITLNPADYSVRQSAQPVSESREITKLHKLDSVLERCISMIQRGQESNPEKYGRVAACLIDNKNNHTYAINMPGPDGTRRHAERVAIDTHLKRHGRIGPNAIMVTTLSPCVHRMSERDGESCTDLLSDYGIEKCYAGWQDPTQQPAEDYPFNLQITNNADIFNTCQHIAASFLPQDMSDNLNETVNPDCFDPAFNDTQHFDGLTYRASAIEENGKEYFQIKVFDDNFQQVGLAKFRPSKRGLVSAITSFKPEYQGQGIARNIYAYVRALGNTIVPSRNQLPPGKAMWAAWKKSGDAKHLMTDVAENFADGKHPEDKGDSKRYHVPTKSSVSNLRKFAKSHSGRAAQLAHWAANMKSGRAKTNEATVATINIGDITVVLDDHVLDRQQQRGIDDRSLDAAIRKLKFPRVIKQMDQIEAGNRFYVMDHTTNVSLGIRKLSDKRYQLKTVFNGRPADHNIAGIITV